jgi:hypothetical protein
LADNAPDAPLGIEAARLELRDAGYCVVCDRIVVRTSEGACPNGHPPAAVSVHLFLAEGEQIPQLPRFNWAAFLIPPLWGPAHGQWAGAVFLPVWLFADSAITAGARGGAALVGALVVAAGTIAAQAWFAKRANGLAWRRIADQMSIPQFLKHERTWAIAAVPIAAALVAWAVWAHQVLPAAR